MKIFNLSCNKLTFCILTFFLFAFLTENAVCEQPKDREYWPTRRLEDFCPGGAGYGLRQAIDSRRIYSE